MPTPRDPAPPPDLVGADEPSTVSEKLNDALTPGAEIEFDPDEAEQAGAFEEDALTASDAADSLEDLMDLDGAFEPAFLDDVGPSVELPWVTHTTNARELYGVRPGETVAEAAARKAREG